MALIEVVEITGDESVEETEVTTKVCLCGLHPLQVVELKCLQVGCSVVVTNLSIGSARSVARVLQVLAARLVTYDTP